MNTTDLSNEFIFVFDKVKQYNEENSLSNDDFLSAEEIIMTEEIRKLGEICEELNKDTLGEIIYQTFY